MTCPTLLLSSRNLGSGGQFHGTISSQLCSSTIHTLNLPSDYSPSRFVRQKKILRQSRENVADLLTREDLWRHNQTFTTGNQTFSFPAVTRRVPDYTRGINKEEDRGRMPPKYFLPFHSWLADRDGKIHGRVLHLVSAKKEGEMRYCMLKVRSSSSKTRAH